MTQPGKQTEDSSLYAVNKKKSTTFDEKNPQSDNYEKIPTPNRKKRKIERDTIPYSKEISHYPVGLFYAHL